MTLPETPNEAPAPTPGQTPAPWETAQRYLEWSRRRTLADLARTRVSLSVEQEHKRDYSARRYEEEISEIEADLADSEQQAGGEGA